MRQIGTVICGAVCLATLGCGSAAKYIALSAIDKTSEPSKIQVLTDFPERGYIEVGAMRISVPNSQPNIEPTGGQLESLKREAAKHGADAVVVLPCRTDPFARTEKGLRIPYVYSLDVFAITWSDGMADTGSASGVDGELTGGDLPPLGEIVEFEEAPVALYRGSLNYPARSGRSGIGGTVWIQSLIDKNGHPHDVRILKSSGVDAGFEEAAKEAAYQDRFRPAKQRGKPRAVWICYKVDFAVRD